ncbi:MAG: hypothetical protein Q7S48_01525 [bacterium]|nr:hypothetical protein [bacterium]
MHSQYNWPLIGHQHIKDYFAKAFSAGRINHAYLFEGPEHVGKFTFAMMLAKTLLCETDHPLPPLLTSPRAGEEPLVEKEGKQLVPCGICRSCIAFEKGVHPDFLALARQEDDTTISVEAMREYIGALQTKPLLGRRRIGIMEEAELMVAAGGNALLKTLEEPRGDAVLFLVSSRAVLPTIASRCQRIRFGFVADKDIEEKFAKVDGCPPILGRFASGRPGLAVAMKDSVVSKSYVERASELTRILAQDEGERLLWVSESFGGKAAASEKRLECASMIRMLQALLRESLSTDDRTTGSLALTTATVSAMLKRTLKAETYLRANADPRLISEYIFLSHDARIT